MSTHLKSDCNKVPCKDCSAPVKQAEGGGWYITLGHPGFNSPENNRQGYATKEAAVAAYRKYSKPAKIQYTVNVAGKVTKTTNFTRFLMLCDKYENDYRYCNVGSSETEARFAKHTGA